jgi:hypothetical protein
VPRICAEAAALFFPLATSNAARPATCAAAADVPVTVPYRPPGTATRMPSPGAATAALPTLLMAITWSLASVAATPITFGMPDG